MDSSLLEAFQRHPQRENVGHIMHVNNLTSMNVSSFLNV